MTALRTKASGAVLLAAFAVGACGDTRPRQLVVERQAVDGRERVETRGPDEALGWHGDSLFTLGGAESGPEAFYRLEEGWVAGDDEANVFVLDPAGFRVVGFDSTGRHFLTVGGEGEGPGELLRPVTVYVDEDGLITVVDQRKQTLEEWDQAGELVGSSRMNIPPQVWRLERTAEGWLHYGPQYGGERVRYALVLHAGDSTELSVTDGANGRRIMFEECGASIMMPPVFAPELVWDAGGGRIAVNVQPEYQVEMWHGRVPSMEIVRERDARPAEERDALRELGHEVPIGTPDCLISSAEVVARRGIADLVPAVRGVRVDPTGALWVERYEPGIRPGPIDVFDSSGEYQGTLPEGFPWPTIFLSENRFAAVQVDSLEVQRLVVYQLQRR